MSMLESIRNVWCMITGKCPVDVTDDEIKDDKTLVSLREREGQARRAIVQRRGRKQEINELETMLDQMVIRKPRPDFLDDTLINQEGDRGR